MYSKSGARKKFEINTWILLATEKFAVTIELTIW